MSSSVLDLKDVGWRVHWIEESALDGINPPHNPGLSFVFRPWSNNLESEDQWEDKDVANFEKEICRGSKQKWNNAEGNLQCVGNIVGPEHREESVSFFALPVVVGGGLGKTVIKTSLIKILPISLIDSISGEPKEEAL